MKNWMFALLALCFSASAVTAQAQYEEGVHYERITRPVPTADPQRIEVTEMFGYLCPHCNSFEPLLKHWSKNRPADVDLVKVPVVFGRSWEPFARAYYVADLLGKVDETHQAMFDAIHLQRKRLRSEEDLAAFYADFNIPAAEFNKQYNSFAVNMKLKQGDAKARGYEITGVPTMIVNGKYRISASSAGGHKEMLQVVDYLIEQERAAQ